VFKLLSQYRPETTATKKQRQRGDAAAAAKGKGKTANVPYQLKFGLKHVTTLVEEKKASIVLIACDVDPIELVLWLLALYREMEAPFPIVKDNAVLVPSSIKRREAQDFPGCVHGVAESWD